MEVSTHVFEKVESYYSLHISALLDHADASLEEGVEGSTLEHAVLQQGEVDELMYDIVVQIGRAHV